MGASVEVQKAVFEKLDATAAVTDQLAAHATEVGKKAIYDEVPQSDAPESTVAFPYLVIGDTTEIAFDADDFDGREATVTIHTFSRYLGMKEAKSVMDAVKAALHNQPLTISGELHLYTFWEFAEVLRDPDGITRHGILRFRLVTVGT